MNDDVRKYFEARELFQIELNNQYLAKESFSNRLEDTILVQKIALQWLNLQSREYEKKKKLNRERYALITLPQISLRSWNIYFLFETETSYYILREDRHAVVAFISQLQVLSVFYVKYTKLWW